MAHRAPKRSTKTPRTTAADQNESLLGDMIEQAMMDVVHSETPRKSDERLKTLLVGTSMDEINATMSSDSDNSTEITKQLFNALSDEQLKESIRLTFAESVMCLALQKHAVRRDQQIMTTERESPKWTKINRWRVMRARIIISLMTSLRARTQKRGVYVPLGVNQSDDTIPIDSDSKFIDSQLFDIFRYIEQCASISEYHEPNCKRPCTICPDKTRVTSTYKVTFHSRHTISISNPYFLCDGCFSVFKSIYKIIHIHSRVGDAIINDVRTHIRTHRNIPLKQILDYITTKHGSDEVKLVLDSLRILKERFNIYYRSIPTARQALKCINIQGLDLFEAGSLCALHNIEMDVQYDTDISYTMTERKIEEWKRGLRSSDDVSAPTVQSTTEDIVDDAITEPTPPVPTKRKRPVASGESESKRPRKTNE